MTPMTILMIILVLKCWWKVAVDGVPKVFVVQPANRRGGGPRVLRYDYDRDAATLVTWLFWVFTHEKEVGPEYVELTPPSPTRGHSWW